MTFTGAASLFDGFVPLTGEEAAGILRAQVADDAREAVVAARGGLGGQQWPVEDAVEFVESAQAVGWLADPLFHHDLVALNESMVFRFAVTRPR